MGGTGSRVPAIGIGSSTPSWARSGDPNESCRSERVVPIRAADPTSRANPTRSGGGSRPIATPAGANPSPPRARGQRIREAWSRGAPGWAGPRPRFGNRPLAGREVWTNLSHQVAVVTWQPRTTAIRRAIVNVGTGFHGDRGCRRARRGPASCGPRVEPDGLVSPARLVLPARLRRSRPAAWTPRRPAAPPPGRPAGLLCSLPQTCGRQKPGERRQVLGGRDVGPGRVVEGPLHHAGQFRPRAQLQEVGDAQRSQGEQGLSPAHR